MTVTITPTQLQLLQGEAFLALLDPSFRDHFQVRLREATNGAYAIMDFGYGAGTVIAALRQLATESPDGASVAKRLIDQIEATL
jgi:hypothetical protein